MTIKELVEFTGKNRTTIERWCAKCTSRITDKVQNAQKGTPSDFTVDEVEEILNAGSMSKDAVSIIMQNAKQPPAIDNNILHFMMKMQEQNQLFMQNVLMEIKNISRPTLQLEKPKEDYFSLLAYCSINSISTNRSELALHGKELRRLTLDKNLELKQIPDERWGKVNSYPVQVLDEYFRV